jgi:hypothetical protein
MPNRGEVWFANLNPMRGTEPGETRPVLIVQAQALLDASHPRGGPSCLDSMFHSLSGASRFSDYAAVSRVVRLSQYTWSGVLPSSALCGRCRL